MNFSIQPIQPAAGKKGGSERFSRGKRGTPSGFSQMLHGMAAARAAQNRQDGFLGGQPRQRDTREEVAEVLRRIEQVNNEIRVRLSL